MKNIAILATDSHLYDQYFSNLANNLSEKYNIFLYATSKKVLDRYILNEKIVCRYIQELDLVDVDIDINYSELYPDFDRYTILNYNNFSINHKRNYFNIKTFFKKNLVDDEIKIVIYEPPSNNFSLICSNLCLEFKLLYIGLFNSRFNDRTDIVFGNSLNHSNQIKNYNSLVREYNIRKNINVDKIVTEFISKAGKSFPDYMQKTMWKSNGYINNIALIAFWILKYPVHFIKHLISKYTIDYSTINIYTHGLNSYNRKMKALFRKVFFPLRYDNIINFNLKYYIFPLHYQPEASTSVWGNVCDNQYTLIHRILMNLPSDTFLFVKDHPAEYLYYNIEVYSKLRNNPKVVLLNSKINNEQLIKKSMGVFSISSTFAFEALVLNKKIGVFGEVFYKEFKNCYYLDSMESIKNFLTIEEGNYDYNDLVDYAYNSIESNADFYTQKSINRSCENVIELINFLDEKEHLLHS